MKKRLPAKILLSSAQFLVSLGGIGFIRPASATWGSLAAGIWLYFLFSSLPVGTKLIIMFCSFFIGAFLTQYIEKNMRIHDPHFVVIDELVGMMITTFFLDQIWWHFGIALICFRIFDIAKLWPASHFDQRSGGFAVMIDDVLMALPALGITHLLIFCLS